MNDKVIVKELIKPIKKSGIYEMGKDLSIVDYRQETAGQVMLFKSQEDYESFRDRNGLSDSDFEDVDISTGGGGDLKNIAYLEAEIIDENKQKFSIYLTKNKFPLLTCVYNYTNDQLDIQAGNAITYCTSYNDNNLITKRTLDSILDSFAIINEEYIALNDFYKIKEGNYEKGIPYVYKYRVNFPNLQFINAFIEHIDVYNDQPISLWMVIDCIYISILSETYLDSLSGTLKVWWKS